MDTTYYYKSTWRRRKAVGGFLSSSHLWEEGTLLPHPSPPSMTKRHGMALCDTGGRPFHVACGACTFWHGTAFWLHGMVKRKRKRKDTAWGRPGSGRQTGFPGRHAAVVCHETWNLHTCHLPCLILIFASSLSSLSPLLGSPTYLIVIFWKELYYPPLTAARTCCRRRKRNKYGGR